MTHEETVTVLPATLDLSGKRVALVGFENPDAAAVAAVLDKAGAFCRNLPSDQATAETLLRSFDGVIAFQGSAEIDLNSLTDAGKPILAAAPYGELVQRIGNIRSQVTDWVGYPCPDEELLVRASGMFAAPPPARDQAAAAPVVLIADDDPSIFALLRATLAANHIQCHLAEDGSAALRMAHTIRPSVMVLDVKMPQMNGFEVLATLRSEVDMAGIQVLMLTGCEQENDIVRAFALGADDYLVKPFNPRELSVRVQRLLRIPR